MLRPTRTATEPLHLQLLRAASCTGLALLLAGPFSGQPGLIAAAVAAIAAVLLAPYLARSRSRLPVIAAGCVGIVACESGVAWVLGQYESPAYWFGLPAVIGGMEVLRVGLRVFGGLLLLRTAALRVPAVAVVEAFAAILAAVALLITHRDMQLGRPFFLADRAFENDLDPTMVLKGIAIGTLAVSFLLFLPRRRPVHTAAGLAMTVLLLVGGSFAWRFILPVFEPKDQQPKDGEHHAMKEKDAPGGRGGQGGTSKQREMEFEPPPPNPQSSRPVAVVNLEDDAVPAGSAWYLRQVAYSRFNGLKLVRVTDETDDADVPAQFPTERITIPGVPDGAEGLKLLRAVVHLIEEQSRPFAPVNPRAMEPRTNPDPEHFRRSYATESLVLVQPEASDGTKGHYLSSLIGKSVGDPAWSTKQREAYLTYPADPRYAELVKRIFAEAVAAGRLPADHARKPLLQAFAIVVWLGKNTTYSLKPQGLSETDPVGDFLFNRRKGYCVHIAHATAFLMRAAGIPSRVGAGFAVKLEDAGSRSSLIVRASDGHAWPEIYVAGFGWVVIDPSPTPEPDTPQPPPVDSRTAQKLDEMSRKDPVPPESPPMKETKRPPSPLRWLPAWLLLAIIASLYGIKAWRQVAPRIAPDAHRQRLAYRAVLDRLAEVGVTRGFGETREAFAARIAETVPAFAGLTDAHLRSAILDILPDSQDWERLRCETTVEFNTNHSRLRRTLGLLNPISWLATR